MNYAQIRSTDISNGEGIGVAIFVQGCDKTPHCKGCFNSETWDFKSGKEFNSKVKEKFFELINKPYIKRVSILGGEPLSRNNCYEIFLLVSEIKNKFPDKKIWIYSGYSYEKFSREQLKAILKADVLIDGEYIEELKNPNLKFRGSLNQRVINIPETLKQNKVILYYD